LLYHIYRVRSFATIILDEPEVYLHPDLQRRLVHLLESTGRQVVVATHSSEIVAEAEPRLVTLVEKGRKNARRARDEATLEQLSFTLGTAFNLRLARALRSRVVLFVEGQDMAIIRRFSKTLRLESIELERGITVIKLEGFSRFNHVAPFTWLCDELLPEAIKVHVLLDRDYRSDTAISHIEKDFGDVGISAHVWRRKELESYLLTPSVIARLSGLAESEAVDALSGATLAMENDVFSRLLGDRIQEEKSASRHSVDVTAEFKAEFDQKWKDLDFRLYHCPAKQVIARLNDLLQTQRKKSVSSRSLASAHRVGEIASEMAEALRQINGAVENL
jgi:predicted ATP-dependent endonuclease of OLD family